MNNDDKLDQIKANLDSLHRRMDALENSRDDSDEDDYPGDPLHEEGDPVSSDIAAVSAQIADLQRRIPPAITPADRERFADAQAKAERVAQAFGDSASPWVRGETLTQYRRRLLSTLKPHSAQWKDVDTRKLDGAALDTVEQQVFADAWTAALDPANVPEGTLRMVVDRDETGRPIRKFIGDPEACWGPFKRPGKIVTAWKI